MGARIARSMNSVIKASARGALWALDNKGWAALIGIVLLALVTASTFAMHPQLAYGDDFLDRMSGGWEALMARMPNDLLEFATTAASPGGLTEWIVGPIIAIGVSYEMLFLNWLIMLTSTGTLLDASFEYLLDDSSTIYNIIATVHNTAVISIANVVLAIFLVIGLARMISKIGMNEGGLDTWKLIWILIMYAVAKIFVDNSFNIGILFFDLAQSLINKVMAVGNDAIPTIDYISTGISDGEFHGQSLIILILNLILILIALIVCAVSYLVPIGRAIQIYVYTCFAPIPLACMVSEEGRQITTSFLKKYAAILIAGAIMALIFLFMRGIAYDLSYPDIDVNGDPRAFLEYMTAYLFIIMCYGGCAIALWKSGEWGRDIMGI